MAKKRRYPELNALKGLIRERGTSYRELADKLDMGINTLSNKINGFYAINGPEMKEIAEILDISPEHISRYFLPAFASKSSKTQHKTA